MTSPVPPVAPPETLTPEQELTLLTTASQKMLATLDLRIIHRALIQAVTQALPATNHVAVVEYDITQNSLRFTEPRLPTLLNDHDQPHIYRTFTTGATFTLHARQADLAPAEADYLHQHQLTSLTLVALWHTTRRTGVLLLGQTSAPAYAPAELHLAEHLGRVAGLALHNARAFHDLTERQDRLTAILNSVTEGSIVIDAHGIVTLVNPQLEALWGVPALRLLDRPMTELLAEEDLRIAAKLGFTPEEVLELLHTIRAGLALNIEKRAYHIGERYVERTGAPILNQLERAIGWVILLRDKTEEYETQRLRQGLFDMIVHDLRSPLTSALTSIHILRDRLLIDTPLPAVRRALDAAQRACRRMLSLVNNLLDVTRLEAAGTLTVQRELVDWHSLVNDVLAELAPMAHETGIGLHNRVPPTLDMLMVDAEKMSRVLMNLVDNALKFTPSGGEVVVTAQTVTHAGRNWLQCSVLDTGPGIPPDYVDKIFDRFVQVANQSGRRSGTGLGLSFCKLAVEAHHGQIWVENRPTGGSAFHFRVPLESSSGAPGAFTHFIP